MILYAYIITLVSKIRFFSLPVEWVFSCEETICSVFSSSFSEFVQVPLICLFEAYQSIPQVYTLSYRLIWRNFKDSSIFFLLLQGSMTLFLFVLELKTQDVELFCKEKNLTVRFQLELREFFHYPSIEFFMEDTESSCLSNCAVFT